MAGNTVSGDQPIGKGDKAYIYLETEVAPVSSGILSEQGIEQTVSGGSCVVLKFPKEVRVMKIRYGISFISSEQARKNLYREIEGYNVDSVAQIGRNIWNEKLNKISVQGQDEDQKTVFILLYIGSVNVRYAFRKMGIIIVDLIKRYIMTMEYLSIQMIGFGTPFEQHIHYELLWTPLLSKIC